MQDVDTPLMRQYNGIKAKYPDAILLFRIGDFYETFGEDAVKTSSCLGIVLTKRANGKAHDLELAGFPHHSLETYLPKLVRAGYRVAICDQLEDPKSVKGIVKRGVTEMITPGVTLSDNILDNRSNNFLASVYVEGNLYGLAFMDISTGEFFVGEGPKSYAEKLLQGFSPAEVLVQKTRREQEVDFLDRFYLFRLDDWAFQFDHGYEQLLQTLQTQSLKGFGIEDEKLSVIAAGAIIQYLKDTEHHQLQHISRIQRIAEENHVWLDRFTIRNLELVWSPHAGATTLLDVLDETLTPPGARMLRKWVVMPLIHQNEILERQSIVDVFFHNEGLSSDLTSHMKGIGDLERLISKVSLEKINPRELIQLKKSLDFIPLIRQTLSSTNDQFIQHIHSQLKELPELTDKIAITLKEDAGPVLSKGNYIADNVHSELDELRHILHSSKDILAGILQEEIQKTGIHSLKIGFNNVFGYYLEVTHVHAQKVPTNWIRKQTMTNAERYITPELKILEEKILGAEEKIKKWEETLYFELVRWLKNFLNQVQHNAQILARLDCLLCFSKVSKKRNYRKPVIRADSILHIVAGRHPVIETHLPVDQPYVPNDVYLDPDAQQILMITGPNMSGKSALLRQTALIVLMAQMGCFVPAKAAELGVVDRLFTRVGASDNISGGESTFMVEMNETASIMNNLSARSLVLLDEIGRGTSTYDGISIAWALAEYLHENKSYRPKTLFATHYHELNELEIRFPRIHNFHVTTRELQNKIIFLRKLVPGGSAHSFGIHVARLAGMPDLLIKRADEILNELENKRRGLSEREDVKPEQKSPPNTQFQLSFFDTPDPLGADIRKWLEETNVNTITPVDALMKIHEWKNKIK